MATVNEQGLLAARFVLAVDTDDPRELAAVMRDVVASEGQTFGLLVALASTVKAYARGAHGDQWRAIMVTSCNLLELGDLGAAGLEDDGAGRGVEW
jgi:hypothetical protein